MNDGASLANGRTGTRGVALLAVLGRALFTVLALFLVEQLLIPFSYVRGLISDAGEYARFVALGLALVAVTALPLALFVVVFRTLAVRLAEAPRLSDPRLGRGAQAAVLLALGALLSLCQDGNFLAPAPAWAMALCLVPCVGFLLATRGIAARVDGAVYNVAALASLILIAWYLLHYETLDRMLEGRYGFRDQKSRLRTWIDLGYPLGLVAGGVFVGLRGVQLRAPRQRAAAVSAAWLVLLALQWANASFFVDLHLPVHTCLLMAGALTAWHASVLLFSDEELRLAQSPRLRAALVAAPVLGLSATIALAPVSGAGYLAATHTTVARFGVELVFEYGMGLDERVDDVLGIAARAARVLRGKPLPASPRPLPSTFARPSLDPASRTEARGAVWFILDMKRARDIGPDDRGNTWTPRIDRCFESGFRFARAISSSTQTSTVIPSIYTSTYAGTRAQHRPDVDVTPRWFALGEPDLADTLRAAGFRTRVLTNEYYLRFFRPSKQRPTFTFDEVIEAARGQPDGNQALLISLRARPDLIPGTGRFLLVVHIQSHGPSELPGVDAVVGAVCDAVDRAGRAGDTVMMLTSDHGVQYGEHGRDTYGRTLFDEELHVPLLWRIPALRGGTVDSPVSAVDHLPTLLALFQIPVSFAVEGRSYARAFSGRPLDGERPIFFEVRRYEVPSAGVLRGDLKLMRWQRTGTEALFDLSRDPGETRNLVDDPAYRAALRELDRSLTRFVQERD